MIMPRIQIQSFVLITLALLVSGCSHVKTIPLNSGESFPPTATEEVKIYTATIPPMKTRELGTTIVRGEEPKINKIYEKFRYEASERGAHYVVDLKLSVIQVTRVTTQCNYSTTGTFCYPVTTFHHPYTATGTLLRRIE